MNDPIRLWFWTITDELTGRRRKATWRMTEEAARSYPGTVQMEGSVEERTMPRNTGVLTNILPGREQGKQAV